MFERVKALLSPSSKDHVRPLERRPGWATWQELHQEGELLQPLFDTSRHASPRRIRRACRIMLGKVFGSYVLDKSHTPTLICGPERTGKTSSIVIPSMITWMGSVVVCDRYGETFKETVGFRTLLGPVYCFNPFGHHSACYNPLHHLSRARAQRTQEICDLARILSAHVNAHADARRLGESILAAALDHVCTLPKSSRHLFHCFTILRQAVMLDEKFAWLDDTEEREAGLAFAVEALMLWDQSKIQRTTRHSSFELEVFWTHHRASTLYICIPPYHTKACAPLLRALMHQLTQYAPKHQPSEQRVLLMLDDMSDYPTFESMHETLERHGRLPFKLCMITHDMKALETLYPNLVTHMNSRLYFRPYCQADAEHISHHTRVVETGQPILTWQEALHDLSGHGVLWRQGHAPALIEKTPYYNDEGLQEHKRAIIEWLRR